MKEFRRQTVNFTAENSQKCGNDLTKWLSLFNLTNSQYNYKFLSILRVPPNFAGSTIRQLEEANED